MDTIKKFNMKKIMLIAVALYCCTSIFAQRKTKVKTTPQKAINVKMAVKGNPENLGFLIGAEKMFKQKKITIKGKSGQDCFRNKQSFVTLNTNINNHASLGNNILLSTEWIKRTTFNDKYFIEGTIGFGYGKGIANGSKTYVKLSDGSLKIKKPDTDYISLNFMYGGGYNFQKKFMLPIKIYAKGGLTGIYYHKFGYFSIIGEIGVITNLSLFKK
jgi:hypothetical protein